MPVIMPESWQPVPVICAHLRAAVADDVAFVAVAYEVNGSGDGDDGTALFCKVSSRNATAAVQRLVGDCVGDVGIHALGGAASQMRGS